MKIGIDANHLSVKIHSGLKNYSENLVSGLSEIDNKNEYYIFVSKKVKIPDKKNFHLVITPRIFPLLKRQFFLSHFVNHHMVDVFHYLNPYGDIFLNHPKIITTVHDLNLKEIYPFSFTYVLNRINCEITRRAVFGKTQVFITPSLFVQKELQEYLESKNNFKPVSVIPEAAGEKFKPHKSSQKQKNGFLCLSDFSERKNTERIIRAFGLLPEKVRMTNKLTIVSTSKKSASKHISLLKELRLSKFSETLYNISDSNLAKLYRKSTCLLYPSLYEGFGLPILEAMASGSPVITSNYGAVKEVAGNAALLVDPKSVKDISGAMIRVVGLKKLREKMIRSGLKRAKEFSWKKCAEQTLSVYIKMYKSKGSLRNK